MSFGVDIVLGQVITAAEVWLSNGVVEEVVDLHGSFLVMKPVPSYPPINAI